MEIIVRLIAYSFYRAKKEEKRNKKGAIIEKFESSLI